MRRITRNVVEKVFLEFCSKFNFPVCSQALDQQGYRYRHSSSRAEHYPEDVGKYYLYVNSTANPFDVYHISVYRGWVDDRISFSQEYLTGRKIVEKMEEMIKDN